MDLEQFAEEFREVGNRRIASLRATWPTGTDAVSVDTKLRLHAKLKGIEMMMDTFDELWELID